MTFLSRFLVVRQTVFTSTNEKIVTGGVSEWIIAVIVVGLASLMFVIAFGTTVVMRHNVPHRPISWLVISSLPFR